MKSAKPFLKWAGGKTQLINDIEKSLPNDEISILWDLQNDFHTLEEYPEKKKEYYYERREQYNTRNTDKTTQAALFIFLNRTCFNGLYRVNRNNQYNVPIGSYKRPTICDLSNILAARGLLQKVEILCGDYQESLNHATENTFFILIRHINH